MSALLLLFVIFFRSNADLPQMPNVVYGGFGYDALLGNPQDTEVATGIDPGYTPSSIWDYESYDMSHVSNDGYWKVPNGVQVLRANSCNGQFSFSTSTGSSEFQNSLDVGAGVSAQYNGGIYKVRFSANVNFQKVHQGFSSGSYVYSTSSLICSTYQINNPQYLENGKQFSEVFVKSVQALPTTYGANQPVCGGADNPFAQFIANFGTHYPAQIVMGCKMGQRSKQSAFSYSSLSSSNINVATAASFSCIGVKGKVAVNTTKSKTEASAYANASLEQSEFFVGNATYKGDLNDYLFQCSKDPYPLSNKLYLITDLLNPINFPDIPDINAKNAALTAAYETYCECMFKQGRLLSDCSGFQPSPPIPAGSIFGGAYSPYVYDNPYTGDYNCPVGHVAYDMSIETFDGNSSYNPTYVCMNDTQIKVIGSDGMGYFGGIYQICPQSQGNVTCAVSNPLTNGCQCPQGMKSQLISAQISKKCPNWYLEQYACYNGDVDPSTSVIGGFYSDNRNCKYEISNPYTKTETCPQGFKAYPTVKYCCTGTANEDKQSCDQTSTQYVCISNIY